MNIIINTMERRTTDGFVTVVHWTVTKTQGEHTASAYGTESFADGQATVPYGDLTEQIVKGWLKEKWSEEGVAAKEDALDAQLAIMANPPMANGLPWGSI